MYSFGCFDEPDSEPYSQMLLFRWLYLPGAAGKAMHAGLLARAACYRCARHRVAWLRPGGMAGGLTVLIGSCGFVLAVFAALQRVSQPIPRAPVVAVGVNVNHHPGKGDLGERPHLQEQQQRHRQRCCSAERAKQHALGIRH
jgi:hypothetical protein